MEWIVVDLTTGAVIIKEGGFANQAAADAYVLTLPPGMKVMVVKVTIT